MTALVVSIEKRKRSPRGHSVIQTNTGEEEYNHWLLGSPRQPSPAVEIVRLGFGVAFVSCGAPCFIACGPATADLVATMATSLYRMPRQ